VELRLGFKFNNGALEAFGGQQQRLWALSSQWGCRLWLELWAGRAAVGLHLVGGAAEERRSIDHLILVLLLLLRVRLSRTEGLGEEACRGCTAVETSVVASEEEEDVAVAIDCCLLLACL